MKSFLGCMGMTRRINLRCHPEETAKTRISTGLLACYPSLDMPYGVS